MWNEQKAIEAIVYMAKQMRDPTKLRICKLLYLADKMHLSVYGRFISGDHYVAMKRGPVPSGTYDLMKGKGVRDTSGSFQVQENKVIACRDADLDEFSRSDLECLDAVIKQYGRASTTTLINLSHDAVWRAVTLNETIFENEHSPKQVEMPLKLIVEVLPNAGDVKNHLKVRGELPITA